MRQALAYITLIPLLLALAACIIGWLACEHPRIAAHIIWRRMRGRVRWIAAIIVIAFCLSGADKVTPLSGHLATLITVLRSGAMLDPSGRIGAAATMAVVDEFAAQTAQIIAAASNVVAAAQAQFDAAAETLTNRNLTVAYLAMDLPRAEPTSHTNSNIAANIERIEQDAGGSNICAWVWFSQEPAIAPLIAIEASVSPDTWVRLTSTTNDYPATVEINGVPCVRYCFEIPADMRGIPFRPAYECQFGGRLPDDYLIVPKDGVLVEANGVAHLPYTGWDYAHPEPWGTNLAVRYAGGIAVEAVFNGTNFTGRVL